MAVREFSNATDDDIIFATGALSGLQYGTIAAIIKRTSVSNYRPIFNPHNAAGTALGSFLLWQSGNVLTWFELPSRSSGATSLTANVWYLIVVRKAQGTATPRFSLYNFTSGLWTHQAGASSMTDWASPGTDGSIRFTYETETDNLDGRIAARAAWANALPWSPDAAGDTALEAAGLQTSLQNWLTSDPSALWAFNQSSIATPVSDLTGSGANQLSIVGTTVVTGDDPPGFAFDASRWRRGDGTILRPFLKTGGILVELQ